MQNKILNFNLLYHEMNLYPTKLFMLILHKYANVIKPKPCLLLIYYQYLIV